MYICWSVQVFSAHNVELVTKSRTEHLTKQDKERSKKNNKTPLETFLGATEEQAIQHAGAGINGVSWLLFMELFKLSSLR